VLTNFPLTLQLGYDIILLKYLEAYYDSY